MNLLKSMAMFAKTIPAYLISVHFIQMLFGEVFGHRKRNGEADHSYGKSVSNGIRANVLYRWQSRGGNSDQIKKRSEDIFL